MSTKIEKQEYSKAYDNITQGEYIVKGALGGYIYKSYESMKGRAATYSEHIKPVLEPNVGGHYYVHGPYTTRYSSAKGTIDFNAVSCNDVNRNAYISMGIITEGSAYYSFDIGMLHDHTHGWVPCAIPHGSKTPHKRIF